MNKIFLSALLICNLNSTAFAQIQYDASSIPEKLKKNANVVTRFENISFEVSDVDRAVYKVHRVFTVLNEAGSKHLLFYVHTNKYISLDDCSIQVYNSFGVPVQKVRRKDLMKQGVQDGLVTDGNYNYVELHAPSYPVTVEIDYAVKFSGTMFYPDYDIQENSQSVQQSSFTVKVPKELGVRFKEKNISLKPQSTEENGQLVYTWKVADLDAQKFEEGSAASEWTSSGITLAPNKFRLYNTYGDMSTWKNFGMWERDLTKGIDVLPAQRVAFFNELVKNASTDREKVALVYNYLQKNFRYVSIQLGIGGFQPFPASFTDEKKYGDCKGLSFYTYSVLKAIGIRSHIALVNAEYNQEPVDADFPCSNFSHMILCVPQPKDSIWLECTSQKIAFGYLGSFTENRNALLITDDGGVLVQTPRSDPSQTKFSAATTVTLHEDGSGQTTSTIFVSGDLQLRMDEGLTTRADDQKDLIVNQLGFKQPDDFMVKRLDPADVKIDLSLEKIPQFSAGSKMFLSPRIYNFWSTAMPETTARLRDYFFHYAEDRSDSTTYQLPEGFTVDALPKPITIAGKYASYRTTYTYLKEKNQLVSTARFILFQNRIPAADYFEMKKFVDMILGDEAQRMVIKKI